MSGRPRDSNVQTAHGPTVPMLEPSKDAQLLPCMNSVNVLIRLCLTKCEFTSCRRNPTGVRTYAGEFEGWRELVQESALRYGTFAGCHKKPVPRHLACNPEEQ